MGKEDSCFRPAPVVGRYHHPPAATSPPKTKEKGSPSLPPCRACVRVVHVCVAATIFSFSSLATWRGGEPVTARAPPYVDLVAEARPQHRRREESDEGQPEYLPPTNGLSPSPSSSPPTLSSPAPPLLLTPLLPPLPAPAGFRGNTSRREGSS